MRQMIVASLFAGTALACGEPNAPEPLDPAPAPDAATTAALGTWVGAKQYPVDVFDATSATVTTNGRTMVYVIGGNGKACCGNGSIRDAVKAYDPVTNAWKARAPIPIPMKATNGAAELDGKIYVTGGFTRYKPDPNGPWRLQTLQSLFVYTPATNTWVRKRDIPVPSVHGASVGYQGKLYVAAGNIVYRYDPSTDQWVQFADRPGRDWWDVSAGVIGGKFYLVNETGGELDILDLGSGTWASGPNRPFRRCNMASATLQARLYLFGLCDDYPTDPDLRLRGLVFDPAANSWSDLTPPPAGTTAAASLTRVIVNGKTRLSLVQGARPNNHYEFVP